MICFFIDYFFLKRNDTVSARLFQNIEYPYCTPSFPAFNTLEVTFLPFFVRESPNIEATAHHTMIPVTRLSIFFIHFFTSVLLFLKITVLSVSYKY